MKVNDLKIGVRLWLGFLLMQVLMVGLAIISYLNMSKIDHSLEKIVEENVRKIELVQKMSDSVQTVARVARTLILMANANEIATEVTKITKARSEYDAAVEALQAMPTTDADKAFLLRLKEVQQATRPLNNQVIEMAKLNKDGEATGLMLNEAGPATQKWQDILDEHIALQKVSNKKDTDLAKEAYRSARTLMLVLNGIAVVLGVIAAFFITRSITQPLRDAMKVARAVAAGDLTQTIVADSKDETGELMRALKDMNENLARIVAEVRSGTETIASASGEIASGNLDLSSRTEQQASSLEETASSMEELTSTVKQNVDNATQAKAMAVAASEVASKGGTVVSQVVDTMGAINDSSKKIADIIGVIDGIAFQTNILALNAAVEAARAGEQGRGFAVVASEVRNLAQRSAAAAKEIKALIVDSVEKVDTGGKLVHQAGATMQEIVDSVKRVTDIITEIAAASQEQSSGIEQINQAIAQMDEVTQQNAALVEEAAAASEAMQDQSRNLEQVVSVFKLDGHQGKTVAAPQLARSSPEALLAMAKQPAVPAKPNGKGQNQLLTLVH